MAEQVEELRIEPQLYLLAQTRPLGEKEVASEELRTAQRIAAQSSELAVLRRAAALASASTSTGIDYRNERVRVRPLNGKHNCPKNRDCTHNPVLTVIICYRQRQINRQNER